MTDFTMQQYIIDAQRTNSDQTGHHGQWTLDFVHGVLGIIEEQDELNNAEDETNAIEELGDNFWFAALICYALKYDPYIGPTEKDPIMMQKAIMSLTTISKKWLAYGWDARDFDSRIKFEEMYNTACCSIQYFIDYMVGKYGIEACQQAMIKNIAKLKERYPEKFTQDNAYNRCKASEYKAIEESGK